MPAAEIAAAITGIRSALDVTKAMIGLRDAEAFRAKSLELQGLILESLDKAIEAREAYAAQLDEIRALKAEIAKFEAWDTEEKRYELKSVGTGATVYVLKPDERGTEPPHWLCTNCFVQRKKSFFQSTREIEKGHLIFRCIGCKSAIAINQNVSEWPA
jgi:hypothetical protein